ncbi:NAD(P)-binding protein [Zopfia rhizophila CBS 207.26]|uniref:NAD(P)-binding protein n=1 Tax=Zopfia rhizophila CBS 207.26 TaxID=1314779 RepID=A0A6A6DD61_9PEZI|nr:NAD(P)-binding protein [Zopfia rhizophila CBS 207.26]
MSSTSTVLITGTNRGIGKGLVTTYLATPNTTVIATVRDPAHPTAQSLSSLPKASGSSLIIVRLDVSSAESITGAIETLKSTHGITALDVVIGNAGIADLTGPPALNPRLGAPELSRAVIPLLRASKAEGKGKFVLISSAGGSLTSMNIIIPVAAYGASKALANFLIKWLALENEDVLIWAMHPGMVVTDMGKNGFEALKEKGIDVTQYVISVEDSTRGIKNVIDDAAAEKTSGKFIAYDGSELPW